MKINIVDQIWKELNQEKKDILIALSLSQFRLPIHKRVTTKRLLSFAGVEIYSNIKG